MESDAKRWTRFAKSFPLKSKAFKRPIVISKITSLNDLRYPWAAYKKGWQILPNNLSIDEFNKALGNILLKFDESYLVHALSINNTLHPVGILTILGIAHPTPYIDWFPWASTRNKVELVLHIVKELKKQSTVAMIYASDAENNLMRLVRAYGLLHWGCTIKNYYQDGSKTNFYYTVPVK